MVEAKLPEPGISTGMAPWEAEDEENVPYHLKISFLGAALRRYVFSSQGQRFRDPP